MAPLPDHEEQNNIMPLKSPIDRMTLAQYLNNAQNSGAVSLEAKVELAKQMMMQQQIQQRMQQQMQLQRQQQEVPVLDHRMMTSAVNPTGMMAPPTLGRNNQFVFENRSNQAASAGKEMLLKVGVNSNNNRAAALGREMLMSGGVKKNNKSKKSSSSSVKSARPSVGLTRSYSGSRRSHDDLMRHQSMPAFVNKSSYSSFHRLPQAQHQFITNSSNTRNEEFQIAAAALAKYSATNEETADPKKRRTTNNGSSDSEHGTTPRSASSQSNLQRLQNIRMDQGHQNDLSRTKSFNLAQVKETGVSSVKNATFSNASFANDASLEQIANLRLQVNQRHAGQLARRGLSSLSSAPVLTAARPSTGTNATFANASFENEAFLQQQAKLQQLAKLQLKMKLHHAGPLTTNLSSLSSSLTAPAPVPNHYAQQRQSASTSQGASVNGSGLKKSPSGNIRQITSSFPHHLYPNATTNVNTNKKENQIPNKNSSTESGTAPSKNEANNRSNNKNISPAEYIQNLAKARGIDPKPEKSLELNDGYFVKPNEENYASYTDDVVRAVRSCDIDTLKEMLKSGRTLQCCNRFGESLIHMVCRRGFVDVAAFFLHQAKVSARVRDDYGRTPMHDACWTCNPNFELMEMLIKEEPRLLFMCDKRQHTPLNYVRRDHWAEWIDFLTKHEDEIFSSLEKDLSTE
mmetsp:Transcript_18936/g.27735  ORF Transcript_18936/g.27735 Transcript_18936/m.27735 type:complete len:686 (-) Transcript_18936:193-2250(-)